MWRDMGENRERPKKEIKGEKFFFEIIVSKKNKYFFIFAALFSLLLFSGLRSMAGDNVRNV